MQPITVPETELKKDYKFLWYIGFDKTVAIGQRTDVFPKFKLLMNHVLTTYISQLCEKVNLPEDSVETQDYDIGMVSVPVPKKFPMPDITVTYLDDSNNSVYNFHKSWQSFIRIGDSMCLEPLYPYTIQGRFIAYENTLNAAQHATLLRAQEYIDGAISGSVLSALSNNLDIYMTPRSLYNYPHLFPVKISRTEANKQGNGLARVTVTYKRIPEIRKSKNFTITNKSMGPFFTSDTSTRIKDANPNFNVMDTIKNQINTKNIFG